MDCSLPGSSVHGIFQVKILEWGAMPSSRGSPQPIDWIGVSCLLHWQVGSLPLVPPGKPINNIRKASRLKSVIFTSVWKKYLGIFLFFYLFWLCRVLVVAHGISHGMWTLSCACGIWFPDQDGTQAPCIGSPMLMPWTTPEVLKYLFLWPWAIFLTFLVLNGNKNSTNFIRTL